MSVLTSLDAVDDVVYQREDVFELAGRELADLQHGLLRDAVLHHWKACEPYRRYAAVDGWTPAMLDRPAAIASIPLLPASVFKRRAVLSCDRSDVVRICASSGTQGSSSRVFRDGTTLERFLGSIDQGADLALPERAAPHRLFVLGPDTEEAADLWFSYVLSIVDLLHPTEFFVRDGVLELDALMEALRPDTGERPVVIGPPVLVRDVALALRDSDVSCRLGEREGQVVTAGGWKRFGNEALPREEFEELVTAAFGLTGSAPVRDCFNAVELNTVLFECEARGKHVPAWLHASARDPVSMHPLRPGDLGVLAFCDSLPTSYPGFVLTDDLGSVSAEGVCPCGRASRVLTVTRRVESVEARGCALKMDKAVTR
ncbi:hypothetical protein ACFW9L_07725 [Streptomyces sp. NPDC059517]|uniref:LuxE/PaaK family acyltransferase n=1 Tax=Streptomyces sp. NPDC059517 TaxID=3346855 RepID=UPI0036BCBAE9